MASDQGPVVQSALLRNELIRLRKDSGLTQDQVAADLDWSPSKLIRVEGGRSSITKVDLDALLTKYGISSESHRERLQAMNRGARERAWWSAYRDELNPTYLDYVGYEAGASFMLRLQRQAELARRSTPPRQYYVIDEAVIRRHVGIKLDPAIMPDQLTHIADRAQHEELLTIRVIPFAAGAHSGLAGPFTLLEFEGAMPDLLYLDSGREASLITGSDPRIGQYADDFEVLLESALPATESIELIRRAAEDLS
jgi:transcriptional regulator with XRE-family HTH domain